MPHKGAQWGSESLPRRSQSGGENVSNFLCAGVEHGGSVGVLNVRFEAVGVGHCHLVYGLFPLGYFSTFNEPAGGSGGAFLRSFFVVRRVDLRYCRS